MIAWPRNYVYGLAASVILTFGSTGCGKSQITGGPDGDAGADASPAQAAALAAFEGEALPLLLDLCGPCHGADDNIGFLLAEPDIRTRITTWPGLVDFANPGMSLLLTKGPHVGPAWAPDESVIIENWIALEAMARGSRTQQPGF